MRLNITTALSIEQSPGGTQTEQQVRAAGTEAVQRALSHFFALDGGTITVGLGYVKVNVTSIEDADTVPPLVAKLAAAGKSGALAKALVDAWPDDTLRSVATAEDTADVAAAYRLGEGDSLFQWALVEAVEGGEADGGGIDHAEAADALRRAADDLYALVAALEALPA